LVPRGLLRAASAKVTAGGQLVWRFTSREMLTTD
jgi:hypothetical protein